MNNTDYCICLCHRESTAINPFCIWCECHQTTYVIPHNSSLKIQITKEISAIDLCTGCVRAKHECSCEKDASRSQSRTLRCAQYDDWEYDEFS